VLDLLDQQHLEPGAVSIDIQAQQAAQRRPGELVRLVQHLQRLLHVVHCDAPRPQWWVE
jgi:hypothetical protein